jgi:predicted DNA-binding helix-hairpin-helix protein
MTTFRVTPDPIEKLAQMGDATAFEPAGDSPRTERRADRAGRYQAHSLADCISNVSTPQGSKPILKSMLTTACERNCNYCPFRAGRARTKRITITPDQMARAFDDLRRARLVDGMFLSSGIIKGGVTTQDKLLDTAEIVRRRYGYRGYLHLKMMPGAEYDQLYRAMQLADRISVNLEGPSEARLRTLAPKKQFDAELLNQLRLAERIRREHPHEKLARPVTQFVVGAAGDTDVELLSLSAHLYRDLRLARVYYSAFHPVVQTPFENLTAVAAQREFRLYQSSFLLRDYGWDVEDLPFTDSGNLDTGIDPKRAYAEQHLRYNPIDLATAERALLLRVPGIGPKGADAIVRARKQGKLRDLGDLRRLGIAAPEQAAPYILIEGKQLPVQERLF